MPFSAKYASESLHGQWGCPAGGKIRRYNVPASIRDKLELVGKTLVENYPRKAPQFCDACVNRVKELYPEVNTRRIPAHDKTYDEPGISESDDEHFPPSKIAKHKHRASAESDDTEIEPPLEPIASTSTEATDVQGTIILSKLNENQIRDVAHVADYKESLCVMLHWYSQVHVICQTCWLLMFTRIYLMN